eukprot:287372-Chlamydomonas_euryale.AAC.1
MGKDLLDIGDGAGAKMFKVPKHMTVKGFGLEAGDVTFLIAKVYGDLASDVSSCSHQMLMDKCILCLRNEDVFLINDIAMGLFGQDLPHPLQERVFLSVDTMERPDEV